MLFFFLLVSLDHFHELLGQRAVLFLVAHALEGADGVVETFFSQVPTGGLRHEADTDPQGHSRDRAQYDHVAPGVTVTGADLQLF